LEHLKKTVLTWYLDPIEHQKIKIMNHLPSTNSNGTDRALYSIENTNVLTGGHRGNGINAAPLIPHIYVLIKHVDALVTLGAILPALPAINYYVHE